MLIAFLQTQELSPGQATELVQDLRRFQNRIGPPGTIQAGGTNSSSNGPDRPLQSIEELREIPSWHNQRLSCWLNSLTVYSQQPNVNAAAATPDTQAAIQWLRGHQGIDPAFTSLATANADGSVLGEVFRIRATGKVSKEVTATREWVGRLTGDVRNPILTMVWTTAWPDAAVKESCSRTK